MPALAEHKANAVAAAVSDPVSAYVEELVATALKRKLYERTTWLRLGHYREALFGGYESEVDGRAFFLAADGAEDPKAELVATLRGFFDVGGTREVAAEQNAMAAKLQHPLCRFPARLLWLSKELSFDWSRLRGQQCQEFSEFLEQMQPESLTLVFSSYYLNNPASAFGHTFLRVNKRRKAGREGQDLLDYGIDFSATVDTTNALVYAVKGLTGMFPGVFRRIPYYYKVREYNDFESRDLWEYDLSLTQEQVILATAHLWELGSTYFDYYYLSENCSYHVLGAIEVADPNIDLLEHVRWPALPVDTIRALQENPGLVRDVRYRPSGRTQYRLRLEGLSDDEVEWVALLIADPSAPLPADLAPESQVRVLDAALDLADSKFVDELVKDEQSRDREASQVKQDLLLRRAKLLLKSDAFEVEPPVRDRPHESHFARRVAMGSGWDRERGAFHQLGLRLALHDLADPPTGYPEYAQIEFLPTSFRYYAEEPRLWLEEFSLVRVMSLSPWTRFEKPLSWTVRGGLSRIRDAGCDACLATLGEVGGGLTLSAFDDGAMFYLLSVVEASALAPIRGGIADLPLRAGFGPQAGVRLRLNDDFVGVFQGRFAYLPTQTPRTTWRGTGTLRYQYQKNFALSAEAELQPDQLSVFGASMIYF